MVQKRLVEGDAHEDKMKRIAVGATIGGVLLIVFLVVILIVQFVTMAQKRKELKELEDQAAKYDQMIESAQDDLEFYQTEDGLRYLAVRNGWSRDPSGK